MPPGVGIALTGARLGQSDLLDCGIATGAVASDRMAQLIDTLTQDADLEAALARHGEHRRDVAPIARLMP